MEYGPMAVFIWIATAIHFVSDLSALLKRRGRLFFILHCVLYALPFIPLFWWMKVNFLWLIFVSGSHILIDSQGSQIHKLVEEIFIEARNKTMCRPVGLGLDQLFHLMALFIIALFVFVFK